MKPKSLLVGSALFIFCKLVSAQTLLRDEEGPGVVDRAIVLPRGQLDRRSATILARQFLDRYDTGHSILSLVIGTDELEVRASFYHHFAPAGAADFNRLEGLRKLVYDIRSAGVPKGPIARVLSIGGNAMLSYRDSNGVAEQVLHGTDPTRFVIEHLNFEIIHITFTKGSDALAEDVRYRLTFYFRASPRISLSGTIAATRRMGALVKISNVTVLVRPDAWFLEYDDFPVFPAFVKALSAPNAAEYELAPFASCALEAGYGLKCSGRNFAP